MNEDKEIILTPEGKAKLEEELNERTNVIRKKIADEIDNARQQGDLSENAAYHAAIKDKEFNETRIEELTNTINFAKVMKSNPKNNKIDIGENFALVKVGTKTKKEYKLVGGNEADPTQGKISIDSPIGKAVEGKKFGDKVTVELPTGNIEFEIVKV